MEPFEYESMEPEAAAPQPQAAEDGFYHGAGAGQKEQTFTSASYVNYEPYRVHQPPVQEKPAAEKTERKKKKKSKKASKVILQSAIALVVAIVLVISSCGLTAVLTSAYWKNQWNQQFSILLHYVDEKSAALQQQLEGLKDRPGTGSGILDTEMDTLTAAQIYANNVDCVVALTCRVNSASGNTGTSAGTGFVISEDGYIVTNHHVIDSANKITVTMHDGTELQARLIGSDSTNDVALIKVEATGMKAVKLGSSAELVVGDQVVAIGNALGELSSSLTVGYISGIDRDISTDGSVINMLQTDAAINSGNSGGPLFNAKGEVVGITTAKYSGTTTSGAAIESIGFAIPLDDVREILDDLMTYGYVRSGYLGVYVQDVDASVADFYGFPVGVYVYSVEPGFCADEAGIQAKDIMVELGGYKITCMNDLSRALRQFEAGDTVTIRLWRGGQDILVEVTLDEKPRT